MLTLCVIRQCSFYHASMISSCTEQHRAGWHPLQVEIRKGMMFSLEISFWWVLLVFNKHVEVQHLQHRFDKSVLARCLRPITDFSALCSKFFTWVKRPSKADCSVQLTQNSSVLIWNDPVSWWKHFNLWTYMTLMILLKINDNCICCCSKYLLFPKCSKQTVLGNTALGWLTHLSRFVRLIIN